MHIGGKILYAGHLSICFDRSKLSSISFKQSYVMDDFFNTVDLLNISSAVAAAAVTLLVTKHVTEQAIDWVKLPANVADVDNILPIKTNWSTQIVLALRINTETKSKSGH